MQSWSEYNYTYKFVENPLNGIKTTTIMEVHTTHEIVCNGILYTNIANIKSPNNLLCFVNNFRKERLKINNKLYDINTNSYKNLTSNKRFDIVGLYDNFENYILSKNKK